MKVQGLAYVGLRGTLLVYGKAKWLNSEMMEDMETKQVQTLTHHLLCAILEEQTRRSGRS